MNEDRQGGPIYLVSIYELTAPLGLEPRTSKLTVSRTTNCAIEHCMMENNGIEPMTSSTGNWRSTSELIPHMLPVGIEPTLAEL